MEFFKYEASDVWFAEGLIWVKLKDGQIAGLPIVDFPILAAASNDQLQQFEIIDGYALYWSELDEDLSVAGFFEKKIQPEQHPVFTEGYS